MEIYFNNKRIEIQPFQGWLSLCYRFPPVNTGGHEHLTPSEFSKTECHDDQENNPYGLNISDPQFHWGLTNEQRTQP